MEKSRKTFSDIINEAMVAANTVDSDKLLFSYKGLLYLATFCSPEVFRAMDFLEARRDDILARYPKSGTNWLGQVLNDLVAIYKRKRRIKKAACITKKCNNSPTLKWEILGNTMWAQNTCRTNRLPFQRVTVAHLLPKNLPSSIFRNKAKILLLICNPKDVTTSFCYFSNVPWGCYFEYHYKWNKYAADENVMTVTYEELKENPVLGFKNIVSFFGVCLTEKELQSVVERSSFQSMKKNSLKTQKKHGDVFFHKGGVSVWKNLFSEDQNKKMDEEFEERIKGTKLRTKLNYEQYSKA